jgi:hypothetical protein
MNIQDFDPDRSWLTPLSPGQAIWYIGTVNSIREGLDLFFANLNKHGHILIGEPIIFDYLWDGYLGDGLCYVVLYKSLPKLEYLEYMYEQQVDKNQKTQ